MMFFCEAYRCSMEEKHCVEYQDAVRESESGEVALRSRNGDWAMLHRGHCMNCGQGKEVRRLEDEKVRLEKEGEDMEENRCDIANCTAKPVARGLCGPHYDKWRKGNEEVVRIMGRPFSRVQPEKKKRKVRQDGQDVKKKEENSVNPVGESSVDELERVQRTIRVLVAAGIVTAEQVEHAYELVG